MLSARCEMKYFSIPQQKQAKKKPHRLNHTKADGGTEKREGTLCEQYAHFFIYANRVPIVYFNWIS